MTDLLKGNLAARLRTGLQSALRLAGTRGLVEGALVLERNIKRELSKPGTGRSYPRGKKFHVASAPGEPPAVDAGRLRSSIGHEEVQLLGETISIRVGTNVEYAAALEFGNVYKNGRVLLPRPFMRPALEASKQEMTDALVADLQVGARAAFQ